MARLDGRTMDNSLAAATQEALAWTLLADAVNEQVREARAKLDTLMAAAGSAKQIHPYGAYTRAGGGAEGTVTDAAALLAWTRAHRPDMIRTVLDPKWVELVKAMAAEFGVASDPETGETIPGVTRTPKPMSLRVQKNPAAVDAARRFVREQVALWAQVQLPAVDDH